MYSFMKCLSFTKYIDTISMYDKVYVKFIIYLFFMN